MHAIRSGRSYPRHREDEKWLGEEKLINKKPNFVWLGSSEHTNLGVAPYVAVDNPPKWILDARGSARENGSQGCDVICGLIPFHTARNVWNLSVMSIGLISNKMVGVAHKSSKIWIKSTWQISLKMEMSSLEHQVTCGTRMSTRHVPQSACNGSSSGWSVKQDERLSTPKFVLSLIL